MTSCPSADGQVGRKRKLEEHGIYPIRAKRSKVERRRDGSVAEGVQSTNAESVQQDGQIALAEAGDAHTRVESRKQRKAAKKAARQVNGSAGGREKSQGNIQEARLRKSKSNSTHPPDRGLGARRPSAPSWTLLQPSAGRFLDHDPIFVQDEEGKDFIIAATEREVQVLSLETSLVVRTLPNPGVLAYAIDDAFPTTVYIANEDSSIYTREWTKEDGSMTQLGTAHGRVRAIAVKSYSEVDDSTPFMVSARRHKYAISKLDTELFSTKRPLQDIRVLGRGEFVVAQGPSAIVIGSRREESFEYTWIEIPLKTKSTCFEARLSPAQTGNRKERKRSGLSLAVGNEDGQIHLYDDVSSIFNQQGNQTPPSPRILHWHREAVSSVKFSQDGNYLISGGKETVLVIWQLQTGKRQDLPHLTSEIERIVVNPEGNRYALKMGDNSIMVLSTSELKPVANFAGLQMPSRKEAATGVHFPTPAAALHPKIPNQLLMTVPATQPKVSGDRTSRPFLQTFDISSSRHIARQALTRTLVTDFNTSPEGIPIHTPDAKQLALSRDGLWMATVDEWAPPAAQLTAFATSERGLETWRQNQREVYLRFWRWDEEIGLWGQVARVDAPHARSPPYSMGAGVIPALVSNPARNGFATMGEDSCVKIWKPKTRDRNGVVIKNPEDFKWKCKRTIELVKDRYRLEGTLEEPVESLEACMAYCEDGSMLAVSPATLDPSVPPLVHFINTATGGVNTKQGMAKYQIRSVGFHNRYFIAVSRPAAYVWDLVDDRCLYKVKLGSSKKVHAELEDPILAVDHDSGTFAVVVHDEKKQGSKVKTYGLREPKCLYKQDFDLRIETILAGEGSKGYALLFADATIRTLLPPFATQMHVFPPAEIASAPPPLAAQGESSLEPNVTTSDPEMDDGLTAAASGQDKRRTFVEEEDDRPVVRPEQLARIFESEHSHTVPPAIDQFWAVMDLFARKPYGQTREE